MPVGNYSYQFFICCPRDCVRQQMLNAPFGINGLKKPSVDCNYIFTMDLAPNGIPSSPKPNFPYVSDFKGKGILNL